MRIKRKNDLSPQLVKIFGAVIWHPATPMRRPPA
jgi:hypothetical protein